MEKKYKIRKREDGHWYLLGHVGAGHYIRLSGILSSQQMAIKLMDYRERQHHHQDLVSVEATA